jgi:organic radical activating enzyme
MHASHVDVGLDSRRTAHSPATQTLDFLWLELTNRCNLQCVHCYTESHPRSGDRDVLTTQDYERLMREAYDPWLPQASVIGAEPQLNRDFQKLLVTANTIGFEFIEVFSNLTQLDEWTICYAADNGSCFATSVYSDEPEMHDAITQVKSSHARTVRNLKKLIDRGIETRAATIVINQDRANVKRTKRFLTALGVTHVKKRTSSRVRPRREHSLATRAARRPVRSLLVGQVVHRAGRRRLHVRHGEAMARRQRPRNVTRRDRWGALARRHAPNDFRYHLGAEDRQSRQRRRSRHPRTRDGAQADQAAQAVCSLQAQSQASSQAKGQKAGRNAVVG